MPSDARDNYSPLIMELDIDVLLNVDVDGKNIVWKNQVFI